MGLPLKAGVRGCQAQTPRPGVSTWTRGLFRELAKVQKDPSQDKEETDLSTHSLGSWQACPGGGHGTVSGATPPHPGGSAGQSQQPGRLRPLGKAIPRKW